jgi:hypothetical protein
MNHAFVILTALLLAPLPVKAEKDSAFDQKAATLFTKKYSYHA